MTHGSGRLRFFRRSRFIRNFGDELSPVIVNALRRRFGLGAYAATAPAFIALGSVLHLATDGTVVWGSGLNAKMTRPQDHAFERLDVRAVRGPLTRAFLLERGVRCPEVFGDPGALMPLIVDAREVPSRSPGGVVVVPNLNDLQRFTGAPRVVSPLAHWRVVLSEIVNAELVLGSSLHAVILAEAYGVPARVVLPEGHAETPLKYEDYYEGTGRAGVRMARRVEEGLELGGVEAPRWSPEPLLEAFPKDLFEPASAPLRYARRVAGLLGTSPAGRATGR